MVLLLLLGCASLAAERTSTTGSEGANASGRKLSSSSHSRHTGNSQASAHRSKVRQAAGSTRRHLTPAKKKGPRGQQVISAERTQEIQQALIREHYLDGEPSGVWDQRTKDAMLRYQGENGWQTKITPDSRALIKLGLGPRHDGLLNPDSAALDSPHELGVERPIPGGR